MARSSRGDYLVLDTDVSSDLIRGRLPGPLIALIADRQWCVSFVTVGELYRWAAGNGWGKRRRREMESFLERTVILSYDDRVAQTWGAIAAAADRRGRRPAVNDTWTAACCLVLGLPLVTRNIKDFVHYAQYEGLVLVNR